MELNEHTISLFGLKHWFFKINYNVIINTWIALAILLVLLIPAYIVLKRKRSIAHFLIIDTVNYFVDLTRQSLGYFEFKHFAFVASIFIFIITCNFLALIPYLVEPTKDPNTTLAIGIISFIYTQYYAIKAHGILQYSKEYFEPFFLMFPLHVVGKIAGILSISFRLFGNIFGGFIISDLYFTMIEGSWWKESLGLFLGINLLVKFFFGIFEGFLQAFVFTMLTVTNLGIAIQTQHSETKNSGHNDDNQDNYDKELENFDQEIASLNLKNMNSDSISCSCQETCQATSQANSQVNLSSSSFNGNNKSSSNFNGDNK